MSIESGRWTPSIGDPTTMGWVTVTIYFVIAIICLRATMVSCQHANKNNSNRNFWLLLSVFLIMLGINKQLDLQSLITQTGKNIAISQGWYENRRIVQVIFISLMGFFSIISTILLIMKYRYNCLAVKIAMSGCIILLSFILIRASSFHHMDVLINMDLGGIKINWLLELGGLTIIGLGGIQYLYKSSHSLSKEN